MTAKPPAYDGFLTTEEVLEDIDAFLEDRSGPAAAPASGPPTGLIVDDDQGTRMRLTQDARTAVRRGDGGGYPKTPLRATQVLEAAARAPGAPAA